MTQTLLIFIKKFCVFSHFFIRNLFAIFAKLFENPYPIMTDQHIKLWDKCRLFIKDNLGDDVLFDTWFKDITSFRYDGSALVLNVPSSFFVEQLDERFGRLIQSALGKVYGKDVKLYYRYYQVQNVPDSATTELSAKPSSTILSGRTAAPANPFAAAEAPDVDSQLNARYNFENYCKGESNKIACAIAASIADNPKNLTFNPLFLFGKTGVGKTHLIQAIGIRIKENNPSARVLYVTARLFIDQYTTAVRNKTINSFVHFYQSIDTLILDDVQDLRDKPGTQNTFYFIFNHLHQNNRQIIMSCDVPPAEMEGFEARLLNRFKWGISTELGNPDFTLRRSVLMQKARQNGVELPQDVADFVAANVTDSIRELEGVIVSLVAHAAVTGTDINMQTARTVVERAVKMQRKTINFEMVAEGVAEHYNINPDKIFTKSRKREVSDARQVVMYLAKKLTNMSLVSIGRLLDRTHATVNYACNVIEERLQIEPQLREDIGKIESAIRAN